MTIYSLSGFALVGERTPSFLIPYFAAEGTGNFFAQQLDENFLIKSFQRFIPDHYGAIEFTPSPIRKQIGELGLLAYQLEARGSVIYGEPALLRPRLAKELPSIQDADFFKLEATILLGDQQRVADAIVLEH
jgi:hypothetical protein